MAIKTIAQQLEETQCAISAIKAGAQSYKMGDVTVQKADLSVLIKDEARLRALHNRSRRNGGRIRLNLSRGQ